MNLKDKINNDLKDAMKSGDKLRLETVRSIRALILEFEKSGSGKEFTDEEGLRILTVAAKKRKESIEQYKNAGRTDLSDKEEAELKIIEEYLPKQLTAEEILAEVKKIADEVGAKTKEDFPKVMPLAAKSLKGKADGKVIREILEKLLSGN
ncbi:MAG: glutamyl-tRNA amidotransferase [Stygiobacter sp. RIFOXYC12_FULL_38_8]|nr:MAG: glutamyl-tRNA amidotransferase [Stygiobacter sp. GWC2_38_9]OGV08265.1 MAG: glutamyl-tRNA amidotransferase [Stygiobacter sp. RIFOXYB2_FULL_37_11]OGV09911.1 MAG: glutamyl-tRNA amidotransferase [Stygiobacter sp. RIFOXYA2_FULL_38_8]OGV15232.1 MAG: glutamyl-tRNA amidotransferase [Stygiobacter sp. RIFOXYC2_FULL_38_25]OGV25112.1 MAG: glutamyl-tRNA amidotransferase [Stygiobacter sp. RIFOXYC12_FULL_38_8]OGV78970.1 MAG: glutamyl-tRNA amidotransferase [Stygiobacter sp. GWF2_38_21]RJQ60477.1 MAG: